MTEVQLTVADTDSPDTAQGIARVDPHTTAQLGINFGDPILLEADGVDAVTAMRSEPNDWESDVIYLDEYTRQNIGVAVGDTITVSDYEMQPARHVVLAAAEEGMRSISLTPQQIATELPDRPVVPETLCPIRIDDPETGRTIALRTYVVATNPEDAVVIDYDTEIDIEVVPDDAEDACEMTATQSPGTVEQESFPHTRSVVRTQVRALGSRMKAAVRSGADRLLNRDSSERRL